MPIDKSLIIWYTTSMTNRSIADLEKKRKKLKLSQQEVANKIGVTLGTYSRWITGKSTPKSAVIQEKISIVLEGLDGVV